MVLLRDHWQIKILYICIYLKCTMWWFDMCIHFKVLMWTTPINTFITSHTYHFILLWGEHLRSTVSKIQLYNTGFLTVVTMLHMRSRNLSTFYLFIHSFIHSYFPPSASFFLLRYNWHITLYCFQVYNIIIQYVYILCNDRHGKSS